jgi:hypothetical protein
MGREDVMTRRARQAGTSPEVEAARITADATRKTAVLGAVAAVVVAVVTGLTGMASNQAGSPPPTPHVAPTHSQLQAPSGGVTVSVEDLDALQRARTLLDRPAIQRSLSRCLDIESTTGIDSVDGRRCKDARLHLMASQRDLVDALVDELRGKGIVIQGV